MHLFVGYWLGHALILSSSDDEVDHATQTASKPLVPAEGKPKQAINPLPQRGPGRARHQPRRSTDVALEEEYVSQLGLTQAASGAQERLLLCEGPLAAFRGGCRDSGA